MHNAGMIGYVLDGHCNKAILAVEAKLPAHSQALCMKPPAEFKRSSLRPDNEKMRETGHSLPDNREFRLHHLFLPGQLSTMGSVD
jgi:hypothetical protein